jgi:hypothetical protein
MSEFSLLQRVTNLKRVITITFEFAGQFSANYEWIPHLIPYDGKIIAYAFNCKGANDATSGINVDLSTNNNINNYDLVAGNFNSGSGYTVNLAPNIALTANSEINIKFKNYIGSSANPFDNAAKYRITLYIQLS